MKAFHRSPVQRLSAAIAATATTMLLFSAVVDLSEPQRGKLIAANAARQATQAQAQIDPPRVVSTVVAGSGTERRRDSTSRAVAGQAAAGQGGRSGG